MCVLVCTCVYVCVCVKKDRGAHWKRRMKWTRPAFDIMVITVSFRQNRINGVEPGRGICFSSFVPGTGDVLTAPGPL